MLRDDVGAVSSPVFPAFATVPQMICVQTAAHGERELLVYGAERLTYRGADERSAALAEGLMSLGVSKGSRVGVLLPSGVNFAVAWLAVTRLGGVFVPFSTFVKPAELRWQLRNADIHTLILRDGFLSNRYAEALAEQVPELIKADGSGLELAAVPVLRNVIVDAVVGDPPAWALEYDRVARRPDTQSEWRVELEKEVRPVDDAIVVYTSGEHRGAEGRHSHAGARWCAIRLM